MSHKIAGLQQEIENIEQHILDLQTDYGNEEQIEKLERKLGNLKWDLRIEQQKAAVTAKETRGPRMG